MKEQIQMPDTHRFTKLELKLMDTIQLLLRQRDYLLRVAPQRRLPEIKELKDVLK